MMLNSHVRFGGLSATAKPLRAGVFILLATAIAFAPVFVYGFPADSWDIRFHSLWARNFSDQLWAGELYPRWLSQINDGLGSCSRRSGWEGSDNQDRNPVSRHWHDCRGVIVAQAELRFWMSRRGDQTLAVIVAWAGGRPRPRLRSSAARRR